MKNFFNTLRFRLVLLVVAATLPLLGLAVVKAVINEGFAVDRATSVLGSVVATVAANQQQSADAAHQLLLVLASRPALAEGNPADCGNYLQALRKAQPLIANVGFIGLDGYFRCHSLDRAEIPFAGDQPFFLDAVAGQPFVVGGYSIGRAVGRPTIPFAMPVLNRAGQVSAVAFVSVDLGELARRVEAKPLPLSALVQVTDRDGLVVAASPPDPAAIGMPLPTPVLRELVKAGRSGTVEALDAGGRQRLYAFTPTVPTTPTAEAPFFVLLSVDRGEVVSPVWQGFGVGLSLLALMAALGGWIAWWLGGRMILRPTAEILEASGLVEAGRYDVRIPIGTVDASSEFTLIARSINRMAEALGEREAELRRALDRSEQAQRRLKDAQRTGLMAEGELDLATGRVSLSDEAVAMFGLAPGRFDGRAETLLEKIHPDDRANYLTRRDKAIRNGTELNIEYRVITPSGAVRWIHNIGQPEPGRAGEPSRRLFVMQDITERKDSELALREMAAVLHRTGEIAKIGGWELIADGLQLRWSDAVHRILEVDTGFVMTLEEALDFYAPEFRASIDAAVQKGFDDGSSWDLELPMVTATGRPIWTRSQGQPVREGGRVVRLVGTLQDITERKFADLAMRESKQRYAALFDAAPLPMYVVDNDSHRFLAVNEAAIREYGYSRDEFSAMGVFDLHPAANFEQLRSYVARSGLPRRSCWQHRRKDGQVFPVEAVSKAICFEDKPARFVTVLDLTAQRLAERGVQEQLFTLQRAADAAAAITRQPGLGRMMQEFVDQVRGVIGVGQALVCLSDGSRGSATFSRALSVSDAQASAWNLQTLPDLVSLFAPALTSNRAICLTPFDVASLWDAQLTKGAETLPPMDGCLVVPLLGREGVYIGLLQLSGKQEGEFTLQDEYVVLELARLAAVAMENVQLIDEVHALNSHLEQKVAQRTEALTRQESLFRALAEQAPQVVWTADARGQLTFLNQAWFDLMGGDLAGWTGTRWQAVVHPDDLPGVNATWSLAQQNSQPFSGVRRLLARDGRLHTMAYRGSPVFDARGAVSFWVGIDADITEMKAIEAELRLSNQELEAFSYSVSHDLRSPLNTIDGFSRLLARQLDAAAGSKSLHYLSRIQAGVSQMGQLIEDILSLAQVSRVQLRHEPIDLSAMAAQCVQALRVRDPEREVSVTIADHLKVYGDSRLIAVVMDNLLGNAWKFSSRQAAAAIEVGQTADLAGVMSFFVRDNGAGFDMAYADKLFRAFQRLHTQGEFPGSGIGLATVDRIVARHGGTLRAESSPGHGASFFFTLPGFTPPGSIEGGLM